jgi:hypothetical protein
VKCSWCKTLRHKWTSEEQKQVCNLVFLFGLWSCDQSTVHSGLCVLCGLCVLMDRFICHKINKYSMVFVPVHALHLWVIHLLPNLYDVWSLDDMLFIVWTYAVSPSYAHLLWVMLFS